MGFHSRENQLWKTVATVDFHHHHHTPIGVWGVVVEESHPSSVCGGTWSVDLPRPIPERRTSARTAGFGR